MLWSMLDSFTAQTPEQARLLLDLGNFAVLGRVIAQESGAGEVARHAHLDLKQVHHRLTRLVGAGLVACTGERTRGGRPIRLYRAAARSYRVPFALTDAVTVGELVQHLHRPLLTGHYRTLGRLLTGDRLGDVTLDLTASGQLSARFARDGAPREGQELAVSQFARHPVSYDTARELTRRLEELAAWFAAQRVPEDSGEATYTLGLLLNIEERR